MADVESAGIQDGAEDRKPRQSRAQVSMQPRRTISNLSSGGRSSNVSSGGRSSSCRPSSGRPFSGRFRARLSSIGGDSEFGGSEEETSLASGPFHDFMERKKAEQRNAMRRTLSGSSPFGKVKGSFLNKTVNNALGLQDDGHNFDKYVSEEQLYDELIDCVLPWRRKLGDKEWAPRGMKAFKEHATFVTKSRKVRVELKSEVIHYQLQHVTSFIHESTSSESYQKRNDRLKDFFKAYHASHSKVDLRMPSSKGKLRLIDSSLKDAQMAFSQALSPTTKERRSTYVDVTQLPCIDPEGMPALAKLDSWKLRNARREKQRKAWELPRQLSRLEEASQCLSGPSTPMSKSATLSGGWGLQDRKSPKRAQTTGSMPRVGSETLLIPNPGRRSLRPSSALTQTLRPSSALTQSSFDWEETRALHAVDEAFKDNFARGSVHQSFMRKSSSAPTLEAGPQEVIENDSAIATLPRMERNPFISPWRKDGSWRKDGDGSQIMAGVESPKAKYIRESELNCVVPKLIPYVTGHSGGLSAPNQALNDCDLLAIGTMLTSTGDLDVLDLEGNGLLTEKSLVPFLTLLFDRQKPITKVSLKNCLRYTLPPGIKECLDVVEQLLVKANGLTRLKSLDLGGIQLGMRSQVKLCQAIQDHDHLTDVCLADTGIGGSMAKQCIAELMNSPSLTALNLSWNSFTPEVFLMLGQRKLQMHSLKSLSIANCSSSQQGKDNPISFFVEYLSHDKSLTHLDISVNRITFRTCLVLEDALENNKHIKEITISNNPFGVLGMRSLLRVLSRQSSAFLHFTSEGCAGGSTLEAVSEDMQVFSVVNPGGRYKLNLHRTYHRAMLRMLYKSCERFKLSPDAVFVDLSYSKGAYSHPPKDEHGIYVVAEQGRLTFTFSMERATEGVFKGIPNNDFELYLRKYREVMRLRPPVHKIVAMMAIWKSVEGRFSEQQMLLEAMGKDFCFTFSQISIFCGSRQIITDILYNLLPIIEGGTPAEFLASRLCTGIGEYVKLNNKEMAFHQFNAQNPTGHYRLLLESPMDFCVAESLVLLDRWETGIGRMLDRVDTSQRGNRSRFRNERFQEMPLQVNSVAEWNMPEWETFECDYVSGKRPPATSQILDSETFSNILVALQNSESEPKQAMLVLKKISHFIYISALQTRQFLGLFKEADVRIDLIICMYMQIVDISNEKVFRVRFEHKAELDKIRHVLGQVTLFPFIQPEQSNFEFDFRWYDSRVALVNLLALANKERDSNIQRYLFTRMDGTVDDLPQGVPRSWEYLDRVPTGGVFRCTYVCSPEDRKIQDRKRMIEAYGWWPGPNSEADVNWWAALTEAPEDVIEFLYFLCAKYGNVWDAFYVLDGAGGDKNLSWKKFEEGVERMKIKKFKGKQKEERLRSIFRYLDPSGEGQVSEDEWGILEQLFKEIMLCISEFAQFLDRSFEDLTLAWDFLDEDGSGGIDLDEWHLAVESMGYFGPAKPIFSYLDKDGEGSVEQEEFFLLQKFLPKAADSETSAT